MNIIKLSSGVLFFDNFSSIDLNPDWLLIPNDTLRYSLVERPGYFKLYHGNPNLFLLINEPAQTYIIDFRNEYVPSSQGLQGGIVVFKTLDNSLELLEYYDETQDASIVYEYLRLEKSGNVYTGYGKNHLSSNWELIGSTEFTGSGKVGICLKGYNASASSSMDIDFIRIYKDHTIKLVNVPLNYTVIICDALGVSIQARKVYNAYNGVTFNLDFIPPFTGKFQVYDEFNVLLKTSDTFDMVGGDVFYYGAYPIVKLNGINLMSTGECFLGYFTDNKIEFTVTIENPYTDNLNGMIISSVQYQDDIGYRFVTFSDSLDGDYVTSLSIGSINSKTTLTVYGRITRDASVIPSSTDPFKFNLGITFS